MPFDKELVHLTCLFFGNQFRSKIGAKSLSRREVFNEIRKLLNADEPSCAMFSFLHICKIDNYKPTTSTSFEIIKKLSDLRLVHKI